MGDVSDIKLIRTDTFFVFGKMPSNMYNHMKQYIHDYKWFQPSTKRTQCVSAYVKPGQIFIYR